MTTSTSSKLFKKILVGLFGLAFSLAACAQYVWLDEKGRKQYSDQPPPSSIPKKNILKSPGLSQRAPVESSDSDGNADASHDANKEDAAASKTSAAPSLADRNAQFQKRKQEQAEKEKKSAEEAQRAATKKRDCERLQAYKRSLESGVRITRTDSNGERNVLDEQQVEREMQETNRHLANCN